MIALTFDDGPSDFTDRLLDCLEANNVKATFFLSGQEAEYFQEPVKRMEELDARLETTLMITRISPHFPPMMLQVSFPAQIS